MLIQQQSKQHRDNLVFSVQLYLQKNEDCFRPNNTNSEKLVNNIVVLLQSARNIALFPEDENIGNLERFRKQPKMCLHAQGALAHINIKDLLACHPQEPVDFRLNVSHLLERLAPQERSTITASQNRISRSKSI